MIDKQGVAGRKAEYHSVPYRAITHFTVETTGTFDGDSELKIYLSGNTVPIQREFKRGTDIILSVSRKHLPSACSVEESP